MMSIINPVSNRSADLPFGSASLFLSRNILAGGSLATSVVDISRHRVKSFGFRGQTQGSWFIDVAFTDPTKLFTLAQGTFPAGPGSIKVASFEEAFRYARGRVLMSQAGSCSAFYGGGVK